MMPKIGRASLYAKLRKYSIDPQVSGLIREKHRNSKIGTSQELAMRSSSDPLRLAKVKAKMRLNSLLFRNSSKKDDI